MSGLTVMQARRFPFPVKPYALLLAGILLSACSALSPVPESGVVDDRTPGQPGQAYDRGEYGEAARLWQQEAIDARPATASQFRLYAADAWLLAGEVEAAEELFPWIDANLLSAPDQALLNLLLAEAALEQSRLIEAQQHIDRVGSSLPRPWSHRYLALSERIQAAPGTVGTRTVQEASRMAAEIQGYDAQAALALLRQLEPVPSSQLAELSRLEGKSDRAAWFDLSLVIRDNLVDGSGLEPAVRDWKQRHSQSPLSTGDALDLWLRYRQQFRHPDRVAVLLPQTGGLRAAGTAIRDGIMSAYLQQPSGSRIRFYGTGDEPESVLAAYFEAADDGADWIIGPLDRESVKALLNLAGLATPVLALNDLPQGSGIPDVLEQQVFGISLSQESEAAAIARRMSDLGYKRAVLLAPENTWGERITRAFEADFLQDDQEILFTARYFPEENDHSELLERALKIDESKARKKRLEDRLGMPLEFEAIRRSDVDAIFLAAGPEQGKLLAPQLRFFEAGDIPTFATSRVYDGKPDPARNQDLDGVYLPLTNWQLEHPTAASIPGLASLRGGEFSTLFAIGMDAWNVLPWLELMRSDPDFRFAGKSGDYSFTAGGNLWREPAWARFSGGVPVPAGNPDQVRSLASQAR